MAYAKKVTARSIELAEARLEATMRRFEQMQNRFNENFLAIAERSGITSVALSEAELEKEFAAIAARFPGSKANPSLPAPNADQSPQSAAAAHE